MVLGLVLGLDMLDDKAELRDALPAGGGDDDDGARLAAGLGRHKELGGRDVLERVQHAHAGNEHVW